MNCAKCNVVLVHGALHCTACGESAPQENTAIQEAGEEQVSQGSDTQEFIQEATQEPVQEPIQEPAQEPAAQNETPVQNEPEQTPKSKIPWKIVAPVAVIAFVIGFAITSLLSSSSVSTALSIGTAFENLGDELAERVENSPFVALLTLEDILEDGSLTVDFVHSTGQGFGMFDTRGSVTMLSHYETDESAFLVDVSVGGFINVNLDVYLNTERLAARSNMLGDTFYGITFDTFRSDIHAFGPLIGLDNETMDELSDIVEAFTDALDNPMFTNPEEFIAPYIELLLDFASNLEHYSSEASVVVGDETINVNRITFTITENTLTELFTDLHRLLENDDALRSYIELQESLQPEGFGGTPASIYDEFFDIFQEIIEQFEQDVSGQITVELDITNNNRLMNSTKTVDIELDGMPIKITAVMDLGMSIHDPWTLNLYTDEGTASLRWTFHELYDTFENRLSFGANNDIIASLTSEWLPESGEFTLSYGYYGTSLESGSFSGILALDDNGGFDLRFDENIDLGDGQSLSIGISGALGANIEQIEFINLDQWDENLVDMIFDLLNFF